MPLGPNGIDSDVMTAFRLKRVRHSIATNGHYFAGPLTFFALNPATYLFTYRLFANHTAENPEGYLNAETLMSFQGVTKNSAGKYEWAPGREKIPENVRPVQHPTPTTSSPTLPKTSILTPSPVVPPPHRRRILHRHLHRRSRRHRTRQPRTDPPRRQHGLAQLLHRRRRRRPNRQRAQRTKSTRGQQPDVPRAHRRFAGDTRSARWVGGERAACCEETGGGAGSGFCGAELPGDYEV
jgi:hypothetical protein